ncbi:MAG: hypothetical protein EBU56_08695 [Burkholderiaceae bacterium]|nr:hypothetical protein [Burkholderiaceae bacterium]
MVSPQDESFMRLAILQAQKAAACNEVPVGAVLVFDDQVIGSISAPELFPKCFGLLNIEDVTLLLCLTAEHWRFNCRLRRFKEFGLEATQALGLPRQIENVIDPNLFNNALRANRAK